MSRAFRMSVSARVPLRCMVFMAFHAAGLLRLKYPASGVTSAIQAKLSLHSIRVSARNR